MLNEDKIKAMTELSIFEKKESKNLDIAGRYFKSDYISNHMLKAFFAYTVSYILILLLVILYSIESIINTVNVMKVLDIFKGYIICYFIGLIIFEAITWYISYKKYLSAKKTYSKYIQKLNRLNKRYEFQSKIKELFREG